MKILIHAAFIHPFIPVFGQWTPPDVPSSETLNYPYHIDTNTVDWITANQILVNMNNYAIGFYKVILVANGAMVDVKIICNNKFLKQFLERCLHFGAFSK